MYQTTLYAAVLCPLCSARHVPLWCRRNDCVCQLTPAIGAYLYWYKEWSDKELDRRHVLPIRHALQGHPKSGSLWEQLINKLLLCIGLQSTTHEWNLYHGVINGDHVLICRQVDDLAISCDIVATYDYILDCMLLYQFHRVGIDQTQHYVQIHCESQDSDGIPDLPTIQTLRAPLWIHIGFSTISCANVYYVLCQIQLFGNQII
jgi:hypothetical protein